MESASSARRRFATVFGTMLITSPLSGLLTALTVSAEPAPPPSTQAAPAQTDRPATPAGRDDWERALSRTPLKKGCFTASYPSVEWQEVPCASPSSHPFIPASGDSRSYNVGGGSYDWTATTSAVTNITSAIGSFDSVTGVTSITGIVGNNPAAPDTFSLQINTNTFNTPACKSAPAGPPCQGWQQFIYSAAHATSILGQPALIIQYWMLDFSGGCPAGWNSYTLRPGGHSDCWINSNPAVVPKLMAANLHQVQLHFWAQAGRGGGNDQVFFTICNPNCTGSTSAFDNKLDLASGWREAEFNVFGDGGASPLATFNAGSTLVVRLALDEGAKTAPSCKYNSFTAEMNSLSLVAKPTDAPGQLPAIQFTQSNVLPNTGAGCAYTAGEPHLQTFDGLLYDFQASGDFLLVEADPDFVVQTRQQRVNWPIPNVTANKAVATKIGGTRIAVCLGPARLEVNGMLVDLADGRSLPLPNGGSVSRNGNVYLIKGQDGEIVRAAISKDDFLDISLDLGYARKKWVRGLLGNANGRTDDDIATRDGRVISQPITFTDLYGPYADSWRVPPDQSLLCRDDNIMLGMPDRPFYANDLDPANFKVGEETCKAAGVKAELLDACILDVGVLGQGAAEFFTRAPTPIAVMPRP